MRAYAFLTASLVRASLVRLARLGAYAALALGATLAGAAEVPVYNTYLGPPFLDAQGGLARELVTVLNRRLEGEYVLRLENLPRARLTRDILGKEPFRGVVLLLNPRFINDPERTKYLWSEPLFVDRNVLVFNRPPPATLDPQGLRGLRFGGVMDSRYRGIDDLVAQGVVVREDAPNELASLRKLADGRVDFVYMNRPMFLAHLRHMDPKEAQKLHAVPAPWLPEFTRHLMVGTAEPVLAQRLFAIVRELKNDAAWKHTLEKYRFSD